MENELPVWPIDDDERRAVFRAAIDDAKPKEPEPEKPLTVFDDVVMWGPQNI